MFTTSFGPFIGELLVPLHPGHLRIRPSGTDGQRRAFDHRFLDHAGLYRTGHSPGCPRMAQRLQLV